MISLHDLNNFVLQHQVDKISNSLLINNFLYRSILFEKYNSDTH